MGTGGAVKLAEPLLDEAFVLLNGDTYLDCDLSVLLGRHVERQADVTVVVCPVEDTASFGTVLTDETGAVTAFCEKGVVETPGIVNAGMYVLRKTLLMTIPKNRPISLEHVLLPEWVATRRVIAFKHQGGFVDIGTPAGYADFVQRHS